MSAAIFPPALRGFVPSGGTLRRCKHSVYIGCDDPGPEALYCSYCTPGGPFATRPVVLPYAGRSMNPGYLKSENSCPSCFSTVHFDEGRKWRCADCDTVFRAPRRVIEAAKIAEAMESECTS